MAIEDGYYGQYLGRTATGQPSGLGAGVGQTATSAAKTAIGSTVASGFSGGYEIEGNLITSALGGRPVSIINADDFVIEHPQFVTFYKDRKKVGLRRLDEISRIVSR